jgi:hypothetical protein
MLRTLVRRLALVMVGYVLSWHVALFGFFLSVGIPLRGDDSAVTAYRHDIHSMFRRGDNDFVDAVQTIAIGATILIAATVITVGKFRRGVRTSHTSER